MRRSSALTGEHAVTGVAAAGGDEDELLALAAAVESDGEHPLARAIVAAARDGGVEVRRASDFALMTGRGVRARAEPGGTSAPGQRIAERIVRSLERAEQGL